MTSLSPKRATVTLPWPPKELTPHAKGHWGPKSRATKSYRTTCGRECQAQGVKRLEADAVHATITMYPPNRRADRHNSEAAFKAGIDGIADVIGVNDRNWRIAWVHGDPVPGGRVVVSLEPADSWEHISDPVSRVMAGIPMPKRGAA